MAQGSATGSGNLQSTGTYSVVSSSNSPFYLTDNGDGSFSVTQTSVIQFAYSSDQGTLVGLAQFSSVLATDNQAQSALEGKLTVTGGTFASYFPAGGDLDITLGLNGSLNMLLGRQGFVSAEFLYAWLVPTASCPVGSDSPSRSKPAGVEVADKVPLGGYVQSPHNCFRVYVPDKFGGKLTVDVAGGTLKGITGPDGKPFTNGSDTGQDKQGWYIIRTAGDNVKEVENTFVQDGTAKTVPWNFFFFPHHIKIPNDPGKDLRSRLYDNPGAYKKFDMQFKLGTTSFDWEEKNHKCASPDCATWEGHCWGSALASIIMQDPAAANGYTQDELEGLSSEFFDNRNPTANLLGDWLPQEKPVPGKDDTDKYVHAFHKGLRKMLRTENKPVHLNLRQESGVKSSEPKGEVWNQGCYTYSSSMMEDPDAAGDPIKDKIFQIKFDTTFICNDDFLDPPTDKGVSTKDPKAYPQGRREQESTYILMYGNDGDIKDNQPVAGRTQDWLTMKLKHSFRQGDLKTPIDLFVPRSMADVTAAADFTKQGLREIKINPSVTADRLGRLGLKKNDGF